MRSLLQFSKEDIVTLNICCPSSQMWRMRLEREKTSCPQPHSQEVILMELKPGISDSRGHFPPMTPLCLAAYKDSFLLHGVITLKPKCSTVSLRNQVPRSQCLERSALAKCLFGGPLHLLSVLSRHRLNLARVPSPHQEENDSSSLCRTRKQDVFRVSGCFQ